MRTGSGTSSRPATILGRRSDCRPQIAQHGVPLGVMPHEPGRLGEAPEAASADIVVVDFGLTHARGGGDVAEPGKLAKKSRFSWAVRGRRYSLA